MTFVGGRDPRWVDAILDWRWTWLAARIGITSAYLFGGVAKLFDFRSAVLEQEHFGLHPGWLWASASIVVEIAGPVLLIVGCYVWLAAGALGVLTAVATIVADDFWTMQGHARFVATNGFFEHLGLIASFVLAALIAEHAQRNHQQ